MSLISFRNVVMPLQSKFQMGALLIATLLVLVIRFGIGATTNEPQSFGASHSAREQLSEEQAGQLLDLIDSDKPSRRANSTKPTQDGMLRELVDGRFDRESKERRFERERGSESFGDIRKSLGLE